MRPRPWPHGSRRRYAPPHHEGIELANAPHSLFFGRRGMRPLSLPSGTAEGDGAPVGATSWLSPFPATSLWREARADRRSIAAFFRRPCGRLHAPGPCYLGRGTRRRLAAPSSPSPADSPQSGLNAARPGPGAPRAFVCETKPQAAASDPTATNASRRRPSTDRTNCI